MAHDKSVERMEVGLNSLQTSIHSAGARRDRQDEEIEKQGEQLDLLEEKTDQLILELVPLKGLNPVAAKRGGTMGSGGCRSRGSESKAGQGRNQRGFSGSPPGFGHLQYQGAASRELARRRQRMETNFGCRHPMRNHWSAGSVVNGARSRKQTLTNTRFPNRRSGQPPVQLGVDLFHLVPVNRKEWPNGIQSHRTFAESTVVFGRSEAVRFRKPEGETPIPRCGGSGERERSKGRFHLRLVRLFFGSFDGRRRLRFKWFIRSGKLLLP